MTNRVVGGLQDQATVEQRVESGRRPTGSPPTGTSFHDRLVGDHDGSPFPCFFGAESVANGDPLYTAVPSMTSRDALLDLGRTLLEYLDTYEGPQRPRVAGRLLQTARTRPIRARLSRGALAYPSVPARPRPRAVARRHPDRPGRPVLGVLLRRRTDVSDLSRPVLRPAAEPTLSRRPGGHVPAPGPFRSLDVTGTRRWGQQAREIIQDRLEEYDGVCPHADLGDWGVDGDRGGASTCCRATTRRRRTSARSR